MKIYFAGSIRGGRNDVELYMKIINFLKTKGDVLTEHIGDPNLLESGEKELKDKEIHDRDLSWLNESDIVIAEVTNPSLGVGYEIGIAVKENKKILCLYRPKEGKQLSAMISGCNKLIVKKYQTIEEAEQIINEFI